MPVALFPVPFTSWTEAVVVGVMPGLPAATAGLVPGDVIVSINGYAVTSPSGIQARLEPYHPGDQVSIGWQNSSGQTHTATPVPPLPRAGRSRSHSLPARLIPVAHMVRSAS